MKTRKKENSSTVIKRQWRQQNGTSGVAQDFLLLHRRDSESHRSAASWWAVSEDLVMKSWPITALHQSNWANFGKFPSKWENTAFPTTVLLFSNHRGAVLLESSGELLVQKTGTETFVGSRSNVTGWVKHQQVEFFHSQGFSLKILNTSLIFSGQTGIHNWIVSWYDYSVRI